jgi:hypothetical protein
MRHHGPWSRRQSDAMEAARRTGAVDARSNSREAEEGTEVRGLEIAERTAEKKNANVDALARSGCPMPWRGIEAML